MRRLLAAFLVLPSTIATGQNASFTPTRSPSFQRIVIYEPTPQAIRITHQADQLILTSASVIKLTTPLGRRSHVLTEASVRPGRVVIPIGVGASFRQFREGSNQIIDVFAPVPSTRSATATRDPTTTRPVQSLIPGLPSELSAKVDNPRLAPEQQSSLQATASDQPARSRSASKPPTNASGTTAPSPAAPASIAASSVMTPASARAILLPFSSDVGVAAIRRRASVVLFFDEPRPIDLSAFQSDPVFAQARVFMQANDTQITFPLAADQPISLSHQPDGWLVTLANPADMTAIRLDASKTELHFLMARPGKTLTVTDPLSGATLLIGTDRAARSAFAPARRSAAFIVEHSEVGVVVRPLSDRLSLRPIRSGFALFRDDGGKLGFPTHSANPPVTGVLASDASRSFTFETGTDKELLVLLDQQLLNAAKAPPQARLGPRLSAAATMLALGMEREAGTLLRVAFADDPAAQSNPTARWLQAMARTLIEPDDGEAFADPKLPETDELKFWRALTVSPTRPLSDADASTLRGGLPLLLSYPDHLRDRAAALAAQLLLAGATAPDLDMLAKLPQTARTVVPQASALAVRGAPAEALTKLDALASDRDLKTSSDAVLAAARLRATLHRPEAAQPADTLAAHRLDWRATGQEGYAIMQEADLRRQAGQVAKAFQLWREAERRFPDFAVRAKADIAGSLDALSDPKIAASMTPADFVRVIADCAKEVAARDGTEAQLAPILADRLEALDLPARATGVLREVLDASAPGIAKAQIGVKLASLLLEQDDLPGARNALDSSNATGLPATVERERHLAVAQIAERQGDHASALAALGSDASPDTLDAKAAIYAAAERWHDAKLTLQALTAKLPTDGMLGRRQGDLVVRLATAASRDGDTGLLLTLARTAESRLADPDQQQTLGLMVAPLTQSAPPSRSSAG